MARGNRVVSSVVLLLLLLGLPAAAIAGDDEMPAPARVAEWVLSDTEADLERAVHALAGAPPAYVARVLRHVRRLRTPSTAAPVAAIETAQAEPSPVFLQARIYAARRGTAKTLLGEGRMRGTHLLDAAVAELLQETLEAMPDAELASAPSLLVADRQWGTVEITTPLTYVKSVRVDGQGGDTVRHPVLDVIEEGLRLEVRPAIAADGKSITLAGALTQTAVERPIPVRTVEVEGGTAEVQAPTVREGRLDLHFTVTDGATLAGTGLSDPTDPERELVVLLKVRFLPAGDLPEPAPANPPEAEPTRVITMEVRLLRIAPEARERVFGGEAPDPEHPLRHLEAADVVRLLGPGRGGGQGVRILGTPRLTTFDGQQANVSVLNQTAYVKDFEVRRDGDEVILDPVVDTLQDGLVFEVTPRISADRTCIDFEMLTTWAVLTRPIAEFTTTIEGNEVTLQIPELHVSRVREPFQLAPGGYVLIGGLADDPDGSTTCLLLHAFVTDLDEEERKLLGADSEPTPR